MTAEQLLFHFYTTFGFEKWPKTFEVDADTYGNVCDTLLKYLYDDSLIENAVVIHVGPSKGILFKNVELILKDAS